MTTHYPARNARMPARMSWRAVVFAGMLAASPFAMADDAGPATAQPAPATAPAGTRAMQANDVLIRAISLVGTPYVWGGNTPESGFDCSGLVNYVFRDMLDMALPRTSRDLAALQGPRIASGQLASGDLVFFGVGGSVSHVGIYVGEGRFVHAPNSGGTVRLDRLDGAWWRDHYTGARRLLL